VSPDRDRADERAPATPERAPEAEAAAPAGASPLGMLQGDRGPSSFLALQRTAGNQAAMRAIAAGASPTPPDGGDEPPLAPGDGGDDDHSADPPNWPPKPGGPDRPRG
jgi:hypothetical protein